MKSFLFSAVLLATLLLTGCQQKNVAQRYVLAYVTSGSTSVPDTKYVTHINYAFGKVNKTFDGIDIQNEKRLHEIAALKTKAPHLKVLLSIGGWGAGGFSEMASDRQKRLTFAENCRKVMDKFKIDGIDIDWEAPTADWGGIIKASPDDTENYTLMMRDIRQAIGKKGLLTLASWSTAKYIDFKAVLPYVDFINIMAYDMNELPQHHSALHCSKTAGEELSAETSVKRHLQKGIPADKLLLGIPFYGWGAKPLPPTINYKDIVKLEGYECYWDTTACCPYLKDKDGNIACSYESPKSIALKCKFIKEQGLKGIMYWQYDGDDENGSLRKAAFEGLE